MEGVSKQDFRELDREVGKIGNDVAALKTDVTHINQSLTKLVSKAEFFPVKLIVYGLAAGSMSAVMTAVVNMVMAK